MTSPIQDTSAISEEEHTPDNNVCKYVNNEASLTNEASQGLLTKEFSLSLPISTKKTTEAAVQTDSPAETPPIQINQPTTTTPTPPPPLPNLLKPVSTILSSDTQTKTVMSQRESALKKERRLIRRNTSHQTSISNTTDTSNSSYEKKQYKWRKRRIVSKTHADIPQFTTFHNSCHDNINEDSLNTDVDGNSTQSTERNRSIQNKVSESVNQAVNTLYDDIVEDGGTSSLVHRNTNENIVIDETSTSGVISNTTSHAESESESVKQQSFSEVEMTQNIMFNVTDQSMEQSLRTKCDEWVSRFVQIMEEALTQLLQRNHQILQNVMPPPWTLYEATHCIKITLKDNKEVLNASGRLLNVLDTVSDGGMLIQNKYELWSLNGIRLGYILISNLDFVAISAHILYKAKNTLKNMFDFIFRTN